MCRARQRCVAASEVVKFIGKTTTAEHPLQPLETLTQGLCDSRCLAFTSQFGTRSARRSSSALRMFRAMALHVHELFVAVQPRAWPHSSRRKRWARLSLAPFPVFSPSQEGIQELDAGRDESPVLRVTRVRSLISAVAAICLSRAFRGAVPAIVPTEPPRGRAPNCAPRPRRYCIEPVFQALLVPHRHDVAAGPATPSSPKVIHEVTRASSASSASTSAERGIGPLALAKLADDVGGEQVHRGAAQSKIGRASRPGDAQSPRRVPHRHVREHAQKAAPFRPQQRPSKVRRCSASALTP